MVEVGVGGDRERQGVSRGGGEREGDTDPEADRRHQAVSRARCGAQTHKP